jgi:hypothetical protein
MRSAATGSRVGSRGERIAGGSGCGGLSGGCERELVLVELGEVVRGGDQPPF